MRDDIIRMAREAGFSVGPSRDGPDDVWGVGANLERFFHMAQAHALANIDPSKFMSYQEGVEAGRFAEREACAKVCDAHVDIWIIPAGPKECAAAIRARGQA